MVTPEDIKGWIEAGMPGAEAEVEGDGHHFAARVISSDFTGMNTLKRHRMVYDALGDRMKADIHALSIKALTKEEV